MIDVMRAFAGPVHSGWALSCADSNISWKHTVVAQRPSPCCRAEYLQEDFGFLSNVVRG